MTRKKLVATFILLLRACVLLPINLKAYQSRSAVEVEYERPERMLPSPAKASLLEA